MLTGWRLIFMTRRTSVTDMPDLCESSSMVGSRPVIWRICFWMLRSLVMVSIMWTGMRMVREWSAMERVMAWRIHHVA